MKILIMFSGLLLFFTQTLFANSALKMLDCQYDLIKALNIIPLENSFAPQGFIGYKPYYNAETEKLIQSLGGLAWTTGPGFLLVKDLKSAQIIEAKEYEVQEKNSDAKGNVTFVPVKRKVLRDIMFRPSYIIPEHSFEDFRDFFRKENDSYNEKNPVTSVEMVKEFFNWARKTNAKLVWFEAIEPSNENTSFTMKERPFADLEEFFDPKELTIGVSETSYRPASNLAWRNILKEQKSVLFRHIAGKLWAFPHFRGIIEYRDFKTSSKMKTVYKDARKFARQGYKVLFDPKDRIDEIVERFATQARKSISVGSNRYAREEQRDALKENLKKGNNFSVVMTDPDGRLIAGQVGHFHYGKVEITSIFYDSQFDEKGDLIPLKEILETDSESVKLAKEKENARILFVRKNGVNFTKIIDLALAYLLQSNGIKFLDVGMVSNLTRTIKGKYVSRYDFYELWSQSMSVKQLTYPTIWDPLQDNPFDF